MIVFARSADQFRNTVSWHVTRIGMGIMSGSILIRSIWTTDFGIAASTALLLLVLLSFLDVYIQVREFTDDVILNGLHTRVLLTETGLAIKTPGYPAVFLRKRHCVALKPATFTYVTRSGRELSLFYCASGRWRWFDRLKLASIAFKAWWPDVDVEIRRKYLSQYETARTPVEIAGFCVVFLFGIAVSIWLVRNTSMLNAILLYPVLSQGFLAVHRLVHRKRIRANEELTIQSPDDWMATLYQQRLARLRALGIRDPEGRAATPAPAVFSGFVTKKERQILAIATLVGGAAFAIIVTVIVLHARFYPEGWIATQWTRFRLPISLSAFFLIFGTFQFASGRLYSAAIANTRTLAIRRGRRPFTWLKRRDCVACGKNGLSLIFRDGIERQLVDPSVRDEVRWGEFVARLYDSWWPGTTQQIIVAHQVRMSQPWYWYLIKWSIILFPLLAIANGLVFVGAPPVILLLISVMFLVPTLFLAHAMDYGRSGRFRCPLPPPDSQSDLIPEAVYVED